MVGLSSIRYADGENVGFEDGRPCVIGEGTVPDFVDLKEIKPSSEVVSLQDVSTPPRKFRFDIGDWLAKSDNPLRDAGKPLTISFVVDANGTLRDFQGARGDVRFTNELIALFKAAVDYFPAWRDGHPVASRITLDCLARGTNSAVSCDTSLKNFHTFDGKLVSDALFTNL